MREVVRSLPAHIAAVLDAAVAVGKAAPPGTAVALVGSWASGRARPDSDVDLVLLTDQPETLLRDDSWHGAFGREVRLIRAEDFGALQERRLRLATGLEVEVCIGHSTWAACSPVDAGTRRVVSDGIHVLWDPEGRLAALVEAVTTTGR